MAYMLRRLPFFLIAVFALAINCSSPRSQKRPDLTVIGYVNRADGLGRQSVELIDALKGDLSIEFIATKKSRFADVPSDVIKIIEKSRGAFGKVVLFEDLLWTPCSEEYKALKGPKRSDQIRIAYSMFESSLLPDKWVEILNEYFDAVAVPDPFLVDVYQHSGVALPIFVLPLGLDLNPFLKAPLKQTKKCPFVFGNLSTCIERKNHLTLVRAFALAFGDDPNYKLFINSRLHDSKAERALKQEILNLKLTNVLFSHLELPQDAYLKFFQSIDCYVSLSKGEGFSIQPREAMALGIPAIVTDNTGQHTLCQSGLVFGVPSVRESPAYYHWIQTPCGTHYNCDVQEAASALKEVAQHYDAYLEKNSAARAWSRQYSYDEIKPLYRTLVKPQQVILGPENRLSPTTLMTNSKALYEKYKAL